MRAIVFHGPRDFRPESVPDAALAEPGDAVVRITRSAICGSDLHLWHGAVPAEPGFAVGHEFVGVVEEIGPDVRGVQRGDRVLVSCTVGCGACASCRRGLASGCPVATRGGTRPNVFGFSNELPGGQAEAARVPFAEHNLTRIPESLSDEQALFLTDILPTGFMGAELAEVAPGDTVVVFGAGPVGVFAARAAQIRGAARVIAVEPDASRRERARARGCETVDPSREDVLARVAAVTGAAGADAVIEAVGRPELVAQAAAVSRAGGRVAVIGVIAQGFELPWPLLFMRNLTLRTGLVNPQAFVSRLLPLVESGRLDPTEIISHRLPLAEAVRGYTLFAERREDALKVVLAP